MDEHVPPQVKKGSFHCPHCGTYAHQKWSPIKTHNSVKSGKQQILDGQIGLCQKCGQNTIWLKDEMVYPAASTAPMPHEDMPDDVEIDFNEARQIVDDSPKAAAALLRLAMEKLVQELSGDENADLYNGIGNLIEEGRIDDRIQKALDSVRVTGNDYVHAGEIYSPDDRETALRLFELVNIIIELTISREKLIEEAYNEIPENKMKGIEQRDGNQ